MLCSRPKTGAESIWEVFWMDSTTALIVIAVIAVVAIAGYFLYKKFKAKK